MSKIAFALLSICAISSSIVKPPRSLSQKSEKVKLKSFGIQTGEGIPYYQVSAEMQVGGQPDSNGIAVIFTAVQEGATISAEQVREALGELSIPGPYPDPMIDTAVQDFNSKKSAQIFLVLKSTEIQVLQEVSKKETLNVLAKQDTSQGAAQKVEVPLAQGRLVKVSFSLVNLEGSRQNINQLDYEFEVSDNAQALPQAVTKKDVLTHVVLANPSFILPRKVPKRLSELINKGVSFQFTVSRFELPKVANSDLSQKEEKEEVSISRVLANGMSVKFVLSSHSRTSNEDFSWTIDAIAQGTRKAGVKVSAEDLIELTRVFGNSIEVKEVTISGFLDSINNGKDQIIYNSFGAMKSTPKVQKEVYTQVLKQGISKSIQETSKSALDGQVNEKVEVKQAEISMPILPTVQAHILSNGQTMSVVVDSSVKSKLTKVTITIEGKGKNTKVPASELVKLLQPLLNQEVSVDELSLMASQIDGATSLSGFFYIGEEKGSSYYPRISNPKEKKVLLGNKWMTMQDIEILRQQNPEKFIQDADGGYILILNSGGDQQSSQGQKPSFNINDLGLGWDNFEEQKRIIFEMAQNQNNLKFKRFNEINTGLANQKEFNDYMAKMQHAGYTNEFYINGQFDASQFKQQGGSQQMHSESEVIFDYRFEDGKIYINKLAGMTKDEFNAHLMRLIKENKVSQFELMAWNSVPMEGFENSKVYHTIDGVKMDNDKFEVWRKKKENAERLIVESNSLGIETFYFGGEVYTKVAWVNFVNSHPELGFTLIKNKWVKISREQTQQKTTTTEKENKLEIRDGLVWVNGKSMSFQEYTVWWTALAKKEKWGSGRIAWYSQWTEENVRQSEWSINLNGIRYNREQFKTWRLTHLNNLLRVKSQGGYVYYFNGGEFDENGWLQFLEQNKDKYEYLNGKIYFLNPAKDKVIGGAEQVQKQTGGETGGKKTVVQAKITFEGKAYTEKEFEAVIKQHIEQGYLYENGKFTMPPAPTVEIKAGKVYCNGQLSNWQQFVEWRTKYMNSLIRAYGATNDLVIIIRDMDEAAFKRLSKIYLIGNRQVDEAEFEIWLAQHPTFKRPAPGQSSYKIEVQTIGGKEMTIEEARAFLRENYYLLYTESNGQFHQPQSIEIYFKEGKVFVNQQEFTWENYLKFRDFYLVNSNSIEVINLLNRMDKAAFDKSRNIYFINNQLVNEEAYLQWLKDDPAREDYIKYYRDGAYHFEKRPPFAVLTLDNGSAVEFDTEEQFRLYIEQKKLDIIKVNENRYMEAPKVTISQGNHGFIAGAHMMFVMEEEAYPVKKVDLSKAGAFNFKGFSAIKDESLRALVYSGIFAAGTEIKDSMLVKSENFGFTNHKIVIKIKNVDCEFAVFRTQSSSDYELSTNNAACTGVLANPAVDSSLNCGSKEDPNSIYQAVFNLIDRSKRLGILSQSATFTKNSILGCQTQTSTIRGDSPKVTYNYGFKVQYGNSLCPISIYEKNNAFAYISNYADLNAECRKLLASRRLVIV